MVKSSWQAARYYWLRRFGWGLLEELRPGTVFTTPDGVRAIKTSLKYPNGQCQCVLLASGEYAHFKRKNEALTRPFQPQRVIQPHSVQLHNLRPGAIFADSHGRTGVRSEYSTDGDYPECVNEEDGSIMAISEGNAALVREVLLTVPYHQLSLLQIEQVRTAAQIEGSGWKDLMEAGNVPYCVAVAIVSLPSKMSPGEVASCVSRALLHDDMGQDWIASIAGAFFVPRPDDEIKMSIVVENGEEEHADAVCLALEKTFGVRLLFGARVYRTAPGYNFGCAGILVFYNLSKEQVERAQQALVGAGAAPEDIRTFPQV